MFTVYYTKMNAGKDVIKLPQSPALLFNCLIFLPNNCYDA
jgi:hypothetical protein